MEFPYGRAPLAILVLAIVAGLAVGLHGLSAQADRPDLIFATFTKEHAEAYRPVVAAFEKRHGVRVQVQVVDQRALQSRLQASLQVGAEVPDMVELLDGTLGTFVRGPIEDVGLIDLTDRVAAAGLREKLVATRFGKWSNRGRVFALPHDVHPAMLAYRSDLVAQLGIDVNRLTTWDEFARVGREVTKDLTGDGVPDRYMLDLPADGNDTLRLLLLQQGLDLFDEAGDVAFDDDAVARTIVWYVKQFQGGGRIAFPAGWGQTQAKAMQDGLVLFYFCPDWRTRQFQVDLPSMSGKLALMPLPAWEPGGRRTSTWGGTGLAITKGCKDVDLAWKLAMELYYEPADLGERFDATYILPPLKEAWSLPQVGRPREFYGGQAIGTVMAELAPHVPEEHSHPYQRQALGKLNEAFGNALLYHREHGEDGLLEYTRGELARCAARVRATIGRNRFLKDQPVAKGGES